MVKHLHFGIGCQTFGYHFSHVEVPYWWVEADLRSCKGLGFDALITLAVLGKLDGNVSSFARNLDFWDSSPLSLQIFGQILNPSDVLEYLKPKALVREEATVLCLWWIFATPTVSKQPSPEAQQIGWDQGFFSLCLCRGCTVYHQKIKWWWLEQR